MTIRDGGWELIGYDPALGRSVWRLEEEGKVHFRTDYDISAILAANGACMKESQNAPFGEGCRIASIPLNIFYDKLHAAWEQRDDKFLSRWLNDPDNRAFRTFRGQV